MKIVDPQNIRPYQVMLYVLPGFNLTEFAAVLDTLHSVNQISGSIQYEWKIMSERTESVKSSTGFSVEASAFVEVNSSPDLMILLGGNSCRKVPKLLKSAAHWLKCRNAHVIVLSEAVATLVGVGFFNNQKASVHWQDAASLEFFDGEIYLNKSIYSETGRVTTSGGRIATFDVTLNFLVQIHGRKFADLVADYMLKGEIRQYDAPQRRGLRDRLGSSDVRILRAVEIMEQNIEDTLSMADIARELKISQRQLERLFKAELKETPNNYYKSKRLKRAHKLLEQTSMSMIDIAICAGFSTPSCFSKSYKRKYGQTPLEFRFSSQDPNSLAKISN